MSSSLIDALLPNSSADLHVATPVAAGERPGLLHALAAVPDPRDPRGVRYRLTSLLAVAV